MKTLIYCSLLIFARVLIQLCFSFVSGLIQLCFSSDSVLIQL